MLRKVTGIIITAARRSADSSNGLGGIHRMYFL
jgi:hypothetical protein